MSKSNKNKVFTPKQQRKNLVKMLRRIYDVFVIREAPKSGNYLGGCRYDRSLTRYGCAIGCCIPSKTATKWDEWYDDWTENGTSVIGLSESGINVCGALGLNNNIRNINMLHSIQESHDNSGDTALKTDMLNAIRRVAHNRRIRMSEVTS